MKRKPITIALALLLVASMAFAGMNEKGKPMQMQGKMNGENCQLLTDDQRSKVGDAKRDFEKKAIPLRADVKVLMIEIDEMITDGKTAKEISSKLDKLNAVKAELATNKLDHQVEVRKIVGEENYRKMQMHKKMMPGMQGEHRKKTGGKMHDGRGQKGECRNDGQPRNK
ncbi:MAG: hypothetical protein K9N05_04545 [Candidatus Marinimicrobia bacterium]|nr:hypothetical protein [Candidatus Neomarinimicrobiota bacterium]